MIRARLAAETRARDAAEDARDAAREVRRLRLTRVLDLVASRSPTQRDADRRLFLSRIDTALAREDFIQRGWRSGLNATAIGTFWEEIEPSAFEDG